MTIEETLLHFDRLAPYISEALEHAEGTHTLDDVRQKVASGHLQLWPCPSSAAITEIHEYPQTKILHFFLAAGNLEELRPVYYIIEDWGRALGCTRATFVGRHRWQRTFLTREEELERPSHFLQQGSHS